MDWRHRRWAGDDVYVDNPFLCYQSPTVLSMHDSLIYSLISKQIAIHAWWSTLPAGSRSLLVTWASRLPQETSCAVMSAGKCARHTMWCDPVGSVDVAAALGCGWGFQVTAMCPRITDPQHIYPEAS